MEFVTSDAYLPVMSHLSRTILSVLKLIGFDNNQVVTEDWIRAYGSAFPTPESCKGAIAFPLNLMKPESSVYLTAAMRKPGVLEALAAKPIVLVMGERDRQFPRLLIDGLFREIWPDLRAIELPNAGHFVQEDAPGTLVPMIEQFVSSH